MTTATAAVPPEMQVVTSIRAMKAARRLSTEDMCRHLGIARSTWFDKMRTGQFSIGEVIALSRLLRVPVQALVDGQVTVAYLAASLGTSASRPVKPPRGTHLHVIH